MIETRLVEVHICDFCKKEEAQSWHACIGCGKEACYECSVTEIIDYPHSVHCQGSGDGHYCKECDLKLADDEEHRAYVAVQQHREYRISQAKANEKIAKELEKKTDYFYQKRRSCPKS